MPDVSILPSTEQLPLSAMLTRPNFATSTLNSDAGEIGWRTRDHEVHVVERPERQLALQVSFPEQFDKNMPQRVRVDDDGTFAVPDHKAHLVDVKVADPLRDAHSAPR